MGNKISAVHGVKSDHFYDQGNAINEIWIGDLEVISRLPFGDSDLEQAGWLPGSYPKIPWHHFIIPMHKRDETPSMIADDFLSNTRVYANGSYGICRDWLPKDGYLGMYSGVSLDTGYCIGLVFLLLALGLFIFYIYRTIRATFTWVIMRSISPHLPNPVQVRHNARRAFWIDLAGAFLVLVLGILCFLLGLPALAVATRGLDAPTFILWHGFLMCGGMFICGFVIQPIYIFWYARSHLATVTRGG
ncbi:hypothetical protein N7457_003574 [Penicillium paradoxum]|uniref:uncharacterized protein n=1 Tax=Penicillium paradoxum TaxID=176176 RepID=UPI0025489E0F|nr:uncharacterized protein N7457_003574 [Penicillium paradoxum]KAJ5788584.1 hypothetical protein N7457_003574 [Penicillium paradoxum]